MTGSPYSKVVVSALVLMFIGLIVPGSVHSFWNALLAAVVIAGVGYLIEAAIGRNVSPFGRGVVGFWWRQLLSMLRSLSSQR